MGNGCCKGVKTGIFKPVMIDIIIVVFLVMAVIKGIQRGFIIAIFSIVAIIIGLAAAMKLSTVAAGYLGDSVNVSARWLPVLSFVLVFVLVVVLVRLGANLLQKTIEIAFLGWLNRLAGAVVYILLYMVVLSVLLFYAEQMAIVKKETLAESKLFSWIQPVGPFVINGLGEFIPFFKDMFEKLKLFFNQLSEEVVNSNLKALKRPSFQLYTHVISC